MAKPRTETDTRNAQTETEPDVDDWYRWGRVVLYLEMLVAVLVTGFSLYLTFNGQAGFLT